MTAQDFRRIVTTAAVLTLLVSAAVAIAPTLDWRAGLTMLAEDTTVIAFIGWVFRPLMILATRWRSRWRQIPPPWTTSRDHAVSALIVTVSLVVVDGVLAVTVWYADRATALTAYGATLLGLAALAVLAGWRRAPSNREA
jgi:hypothetical protein